MKHIVRITRKAPVRANAVQEFICTFAAAVNLLLEFLGGAAPIAQFIEDKCDIPQPNN